MRRLALMLLFAGAVYGQPVNPHWRANEAILGVLAGRSTPPKEGIATIDPNQDYDFISTLTLKEGATSVNIILYQGSDTPTSGNVYWREGTSGSWNTQAVSGWFTTITGFSGTEIQVANDWNINASNNYLTKSFFGDTDILAISQSQKAVISGAVGSHFMRSYAIGVSSLTMLGVPDTSNMTSVGAHFMRQYALFADSLTSLAIPDTSGLTSAGGSFMRDYARDTTLLERLELPESAGWFASNDVNWNVPSGRQGVLKGYVKTQAGKDAWGPLTEENRTLWLNQVRDTNDVIVE